MTKIAIIDYHLSNMFSLQNALFHLGFHSKVTSNKKEILYSDIAILPGVGSFPIAMEKLKKLELIDTIKEFIDSKKKFIGICLGMHLLFQNSEEFKITNGLDILKGTVKKIPNNSNFLLPHVGWNKVFSKKDILKEFNNKSFYFVHSFYPELENESISIMKTKYGKFNFTSMIMSNNVIACQFHPEKSSHNGLDLLKKMITNL